MISVRAKAVAMEVSDAIGKKQPVDLGKIIRKQGYSKSTSKTPKRVTETKSYKAVMKPIVEQLEEERQRAVELLKGQISKAKYRDLVDGVDKLTKNIQLLTGKETERVGFSLSKMFNETQDDKPELES